MLAQDTSAKELYPLDCWPTEPPPSLECGDAPDFDLNTVYGNYLIETGEDNWLKIPGAGTGLYILVISRVSQIEEFGVIVRRGTCSSSAFVGAWQWTDSEPDPVTQAFFNSSAGDLLVRVVAPDDPGAQMIYSIGVFGPF